ncbi:MAG: hypothetical protein ACJAXM_001494 [Arenicella sp.]|jgi:hypothetical protein
MHKHYAKYNQSYREPALIDRHRLHLRLVNLPSYDCRKQYTN